MAFLTMLRDEIMAKMVVWMKDMGIPIDTLIFFHRTTLDNITKGQFNLGGGAVALYCTLHNK